ncbi:uncharacterized protein LOC111264362 isoform X1 [Varroa jacobsoni]|uniref:uncharacterized protein LOC111264362 isoform X1 n=1 Tax=Varroa jacobsoni TaxID=62625 RepID=UPI000BF27F90|nr:uncharacterized protein LOC111264362 isoform X1 [Varroa jacobsoni]
MRGLGIAKSFVSTHCLTRPSLVARRQTTATRSPRVLMSTSAQAVQNTVATSEGEWKKIRDDPVQLEALLFKEAIVRCEGNYCYMGVVQAIDPVSKSLIVAQLNGQKDITNLVLCMGSSIEDVFVGEGTSKHGALVQTLFKQQTKEEISPTRLNALRDHLLSHLRAHQLPVEIDLKDGETLRIAQIAYIAPPYTVKEVYCQNEIVMERITKLVEEIPPMQASTETNITLSS